VLVLQEQQLLVLQEQQLLQEQEQLDQASSIDGSVISSISKVALSRALSSTVRLFMQISFFGVTRKAILSEGTSAPEPAQGAMPGQAHGPGRAHGSRPSRQGAP
jgi:hypothetical protein